MYTILVTKNKQYYFATREAGLNLDNARIVFNQFLTLYKESEGYQVNITSQAYIETNHNEHFTDQLTILDQLVKDFEPTKGV